jgi:hypothetical protein
MGVDMKPSLKLAIIFGSVAAVVNFVSFILGALLFSPIAAAIASYFVMNGGREPIAPRLGARVGLIVGSIGSLGFMVSFVAASVLWNLMSLTLTLTSIRDPSFFSNLMAWLAESGLNALILFAIELLVSVLSIGFCVAAGAIVGMIMASRHSASMLSSDNQSL